MRSDVRPLNSVLSQRQQWVVPVYQRHYEWDTGQDKQIPKLWDDLKDKATEFLDEQRTQFPHYFGAIIFSEPPKQPYGVVPQRFLVDGQQRITTFQLTLVAIREVARDYQILRILDAIDAYLYNEKGTGMVKPDRERFKLWPSSFDRLLYQNILESTTDKLRELQKNFFYKNGKLKKTSAPKLLRAFWYLYEGMGDLVQELEDEHDCEQVIDALLTGFLSGFQIVIIQLDQNDDAQEIFASLNGLGKPLSPFDLIRNDVFHRAQKTGEDEQKLFDELWKPFEDPFWSEQVRQGRLKRARADHLITQAVIAETAREVNVSKIATEYQHYVRKRAFQTVAEELGILRRHAETYRSMEERNQQVVFSGIANVLSIWDMSTFYPLILWINAQTLEDDDKAELFQAIESYIIRREICGLTSKSYNKVVPGIIRHLSGQDDILSAFFAHLSGLKGDIARMPTDSEVEQEFVRRDVYGVIPTSRIRYILQKIEYAKRDKFDEVIVSSENLTIEHVMPQSWSEHWALPNEVNAPCEFVWEALYRGYELDDETKSLMEERQRVIDTFGNLTLITNALNPKIGNGPWETKRPYLKESLLALNRQIAGNELWDETIIRQRATDLAQVANEIWRVQST